MSIEKMRFVKISGDNSRLDDLVHTITECGCFQPEAAGKVFSSSVSMGFLPYTE